jgi:hypothetical protein
LIPPHVTFDTRHWYRVVHNTVGSDHSSTASRIEESTSTVFYKYNPDSIQSVTVDRGLFALRYTVTSWLRKLFYIDYLLGSI